MRGGRWDLGLSRVAWKDGEYMSHVMQLHLVTLAVTCLAAAPAAAATWTVDDDLNDLPDADFSVIQDAISASEDGDEIVVYPGTYAESVRLLGTSITLRSTGGPEVTAIEGGPANWGLLMIGSDGAANTVEGFSVRGYATGLWLLGSYEGAEQSTVQNCVIENNELGVRCDQSSTELHDCDISTNGPAGGISCEKSSRPVLVGCTVRNNEGPEGPDAGGGLFSSVDFWNVANDGDTRPVVESTVFCGNVPHQVYGPWTDAGDVCIAFTCSDSDSDGVIDECAQVGDGVHEVPGEYSSIEAAISAAGEGDVVLVGPGVWTSTGNAVLKPDGKQITIRAADGPDVTFLDGEHARQVIRCDSGEQPSTVIDGFTIRHGYANASTGPEDNKGGGVLCFGGNPSLTNCRIIDNYGYAGGGVAIAQGGADLTNCLIANNNANSSAGLLSTDSHVTMTMCVIEGNTAEADGALGGGIYIYGREAGDDGSLWSSIDMADTVIRANTSGTAESYIDASGVLAVRTSMVASNCHIVDNMEPHHESHWQGEIESAVALWGVRGTFSNCTIANNSSDAASGAGIRMIHQPVPQVGPSELRLTDCYVGDNKPRRMASFDEPGSAILSEEGELLILSGTTICGAGPDPVFGGTVEDDGTNCIAAFCGDADGDGTLDMCEADDGDGVFHVPSEYERIQAAAAVAEDGDVILVEPGVYTGVGPAVLTLSGKSLTIRSVVPGEAVLDGEHERPGVQCETFEAAGTVLADFEIRRGGDLTFGSDKGGGVHDESGITIAGCHIHDCAAAYGGGIYADNESGTTIESCTVENCAAAGIFFEFPHSTLEDSTVCGNSSEDQVTGPWEDLGGNLILDSCSPICPDIDEDGQVGANEILLVISYWGSNDSDVDVTGNGIVDAEDLLLVIANWGPCGF